jgi:nucleotide-binding universal stress UspA family protein
MREGVKLESIFHPSDFSEGSEVAFAHALKIALMAGAKLTMLHVEANPSAELARLSRRPQHARAMGAHPARQSQEGGRAARH